MPLRIEESFELRASATNAWRYLGEPRELAAFLPGAELSATPAGDRWPARMTVRVGPGQIAYRGAMMLAERDDLAHRLRIRADGDAALDGSTLHLEATITVDATGDLTSDVRIAADVDVAGGVAQLGPGAVSDIVRPLVRQFVACVRAALEPRASGELGTDTTEESLTLSGAFRERPMLRHTDVALPVPPAAMTRRAGALRALRQSLRVSMIPRIWRATVIRLRRAIPPRDGGR